MLGGARRINIEGTDSREFPMSFESRQGQGVNRVPGLDPRFRLSMRTSMLSEFRDASGALGAFELNRQFVSVGALSTALARLPGIHFENSGGSLWTVGPCRFTFKDREFELSRPYTDVLVAPAEPGAIYRETEDLLRLVRENIMPRWQNRARPRF
jgi:hypothetical protein